MFDSNSDSRRSFLASIAYASAALIFAPLSSFAYEKMDTKVRRIVRKTIGVDAHNHIDVPLDSDEVPGPKLDLIVAFKRSGLSAICMTFATDYKKNVQPGEAYQRFLNGIKSLDATLVDNGMTRSLKLSDVQNAHAKSMPTVIQSVEGCHFLEGKIERVAEAYQYGLRHLGLLHDSDASVPLGDVYTNNPQFGGLTALGKQVVRECNRLGILIDMAHADNETINDAIAISDTPIFVSHTGLDTQLGTNQQLANRYRPRLISKKQAKIVADAGGAIGVWTHLSDSPLEYAQNIRAMVDVVGINSVCLGTDTKLTQPYRSPKLNYTVTGKNDQEKNSSKNIIEKPHIGDRTNEIWANQDQGFYYVVVDALLKTGFTESDIAKIGGGNYLRLFDLATKKQQA